MDWIPWITLQTLQLSALQQRDILNFTVNIENKFDNHGQIPNPTSSAKANGRLWWFVFLIMMTSWYWKLSALLTYCYKYSSKLTWSDPNMSRKRGVKQLENVGDTIISECFLPITCKQSGDNIFTHPAAPNITFGNLTVVCSLQFT